MKHKNRIKIESKDINIELETEFFDNPTARKILESLPIQSKVKTWGDEIYFDTGITAPAQGATMDVEVGDIAYWPAGKCLCIFFGPTPRSSQDKPVPASEVVIVGRASLEPSTLRKVKPGFKITVEKGHPTCFQRGHPTHFTHVIYEWGIPKQGVPLAK